MSEISAEHVNITDWCTAANSITQIKWILHFDFIPIVLQVAPFIQLHNSVSCVCVCVHPGI